MIASNLAGAVLIFCRTAMVQLPLQKPSFRFGAAALKGITITVGSFIEAAEIYQELPAKNFFGGKDHRQVFFCP